MHLKPSAHRAIRVDQCSRQVDEKPSVRTLNFDPFIIGEAPIQPFVIEYYGAQNMSSVARPLPTVTENDRFGLVELKVYPLLPRHPFPHAATARAGTPPGLP